MGSAGWARKWTSSDGNFSIEADLVAFADGQVTLKKADGETISVPIARLSAADRRFVIGERKKLRNPAKPAAPSYATDMQPFLTQYCAACHNEKKAEHGYAVDTFAGLTRTGKKGAMVVPGKPTESLLVQLFQPGRKHMPPDKSPQPTAEQIAKVVEWITAGAVDDTAAPPPTKAPPERKKLRRAP
jgi:hypothetical protein